MITMNVNALSFVEESSEVHTSKYEDVRAIVQAYRPPPGLSGSRIIVR